MARLRRRPKAEVEQGEATPQDPLADVFEDAEGLSGLSPREVVIRTYHLLLNFAEMLGHGRPAGQTAFEYARRLGRTAPQAEEPMRALTWAYSGAMYGGEQVEMPAAGAVQAAWQRVSQALAAGLTPEELDLRRRAYAATRKLEGRQPRATTSSASGGGSS